MTTKALQKHVLTCYSCSEDYFVLLDVDSEADPTNCPFCGSSEIGAYGSEKPKNEDDQVDEG